MDINKKKDGFYLKLNQEDEIKITNEQARAGLEHSITALNFVEKWLELYAHNKWSIDEVPTDAELYIKLDNYFSQSKKVFQQQYDIAPNKANAILNLSNVCKSVISGLRQDLENPYSNNQLLNYQIRGYKELKRFINLFPKTLKQNEPVAKTLRNIFTIPEQFETCLTFLSNVEPPVIDKTNRFLLGERQKGAIAAWIHVINQKGKIKKPTDQELVILLNDQFQGLNLGKDGKTLRNEWTFFKKYKKKFEELINY